MFPQSKVMFEIQLNYLYPSLPPSSHSPWPQAGQQPTSPKLILSSMKSTTQVLKEKSWVILNFFCLYSTHPWPLHLGSPQILSMLPPKNLFNLSDMIFLTALKLLFQVWPPLYFILININGISHQSLLFTPLLPHSVAEIFFLN